MSTTMPRKAAEFWWNLKNRETKFIVPPNVSYYIKKKPYEKWEPVTWKDVFLKRKEKNIQYLNSKLKNNSERILPCYVWVFHNEWVFPFGGWYIYVVTRKTDFAINWKTNWRNEIIYNNLIEKIRDLFPIYNKLTFDFEDWAKEFAKQYPKKSKKRNEEGAVLCWCKINELGDIIDIYKKNDKP